MLIQKKAEVDVENQREFEDTVSQGEQEKEESLEEGK
jgi:hypothetical protein